MTSKEAFEKFRDGYVSDQDRKPTAFETWQAAMGILGIIARKVEAQAATIAHLQADNAKLRATLRRYGKHDSCCGEIVTCVMPCDCGFHKALGETE